MHFSSKHRGRIQFHRSWHRKSHWSRRFEFNTISDSFLLRYISFYVSSVKASRKLICFRKSNQNYSICKTRLSESTIRKRISPIIIKIWIWKEIRNESSPILIALHVATMQKVPFSIECVCRYIEHFGTYKNVLFIASNLHVIFGSGFDFVWS